MTKRKKKGGTTATLQSVAERLQSGALISSCWRWVVRLGVAVAVFAGLWASLRVRDAVLEDERFQLATWQLSFPGLPAWVTPEIAEELESIPLRYEVAPPEGGAVEEDGSMTLMDPGSLSWIRERLESSPWVRTVHDIRLWYPTLSEPGVLEVELVLRRPVAVLEQDGYYYLIDAEARRLGAPYLEPPGAWFGIPRIVGLGERQRVPEAGQRWASQDVRQGIEIARILRDAGILEEFRDPRVEVIDISNLHGRERPRDSEIYLRVGRQRLAWGRSPLSTGARTISLGKLLANLRYVLTNRDRFGHHDVIDLHRRKEYLTGVRG